MKKRVCRNNSNTTIKCYDKGRGFHRGDSRNCLVCQISKSKGGRLPEKPEGMFGFHCPQCERKLRAKEKAVGRRLKCPNCGCELTIPSPTREGSKPAVGDAQKLDTLLSEIRRPSLFDADELVLEESPIENLHERQHQSQLIQETKAAEHRRRLSADRQRRAPHEENKEVIQPHSRRDAIQAQFKDSYTLLDTEEPTASDVLSPSGSPEKPIKKTVFDDDLPELLDNHLVIETLGKAQPTNPADPTHSSLNDQSASSSAEEELDKIVASLGKQAIHVDLASLATSDLPRSDEIHNAPQEAFEEKYRVTCPTCGTIQYVKPAQQGSKIKCPDCTNKLTVPPPPPHWKPSRMKARHNQFNEQAPLVGDDELVVVDQRKKQRTQAMLERAEVELSEEAEEGKLYGTDFDTRRFLATTFQFALDPVTIGVILGYSVVFAIVFAMLQLGLDNDGSAYGQGVLLFCSLTAPVIGILFGMPMISAALAQLESAANQQKRVIDWPSMNIFEHFGDVMGVSVALIAASIPGYMLGTWLGGDLVTAGRLQITGIMLMTFLLFPIFYLSILDGGSALQLVTRDVLRSIKEVGEAWAGYYLKTMIAFSFTLILWYLLLGQGKPPILAAFAGSMLPPLVFFTFQQLGILAHSIGENLSPSEPLAEEKADKEDLEDELETP